MGVGWDELSDFTARRMAPLGLEKTVYVAGEGPGVIVMHEMPGITPQVARFARRVRDAGFCVYLPVLFGTPGRPFSPGYIAGEALRMCVSREFQIFAANRTSPVVDWLRALAAHAHTERGGPGVGAIGMCITGNFALSMLVEPTVIAPVLCQPSLPAMGAPAGLHARPEDVATARRRLEQEDLTLLAYRFEGDALCPAARFTALEKALGPRFKGTTLPDSAGAKDSPIKQPHSVVTFHLVDQDGEPTHAALQEILRFFAQRLRG